MQVIIFESKRWKQAKQNGLTPAVAKSIVESSANEAIKNLPKLSPYLNITVYPHEEAVVKETGTVGWAWDDERVEIYFDPAIPYGIDTMRQQLRNSVSHELNHAARRMKISYDPSMLCYLVDEGLATVFERDYADSDVPWINYEDDKTMRKWLEELLALKERNEGYLFDHPDGRRWIAYKTGVWLIDRAMKPHKLSLKKLTTMPARDILELL